MLSKYSFPDRVHYSSVRQLISSKYTDYHKTCKAKAPGNPLPSPSQFRVSRHAKGSTQRRFELVCIQEKVQSLGPNTQAEGKKAGHLEQ